MSTNRARTPPQAPPIFVVNSSSIVKDARRLIRCSQQTQQKIVENISPDTATFTNVLQPLAHAENAMALEAHILTFYKSVSPDAMIRDASSEAQLLLEAFRGEMAMCEDMFKLVDAVLKNDVNGVLDPENSRLLHKKHKEYIHGGLTLSAGSSRENFAHIKKRLTQLSADFRKNLVEMNDNIWLTPEQLEGLHVDIISTLDEGKDGYEGKLRLSLTSLHIYSVLRYAADPETRRRIYIANDNRCDENVILFREAVILRDKAARLLGYSSHAAFRLEDKMAKTPAAVKGFLSTLQSRLAPAGQAEIAQLKALKKADLVARGKPFDDQFFLWDLPFYHRVMLEKHYSVDQQAIAEYFPVQTTVRGMLDNFQLLFGIVFVEICADEQRELAGCQAGHMVWHTDVQMFSVWNDDELGGGFVGYLYLDLFARDGKYKNAANFNLRPGFTRKDGSRQYPATALVCSFADARSDRPSLLRHDEVVTMFHEFGHAVHDLVSNTMYSRFHGTETAVDFGEAPSQMLENWCWTPQILRGLSKHYSYLPPYAESWKEKYNARSRPPEQIPDTMIESLMKSRHVNGAQMNLRQLSIGLFDMIVHEPESHEAIQSLDISATWNRLRGQVTQLAGPEAMGHSYHWGHGYTTWGHLMGEYDAGYYSYLFSRVYAADMFYAAFQKNPMNAREGRRYRYAVLEKGGQDEMDILTNYLGRGVDVEAFFKELCLEQSL